MYAKDLMVVIERYADAVLADYTTGRSGKGSVAQAVVKNEIAKLDKHIVDLETKCRPQCKPIEKFFT